MKCHRMRIAAAAAALPLFAACAVGPNYVRPPVATPPAYKELSGWKTAEPRDQAIRGKWWEIFNDPVLSGLEDQVDVSNQNLALAAANYRQALALVQAARAAYFPLVTGGLSAGRSRSSSSTGIPSAKGVVNNYNVSAVGTWETDVWGRIGRMVEANAAGAQGSAADLQAIRLSIQGQLAQDYFQLRALDAQQQLLENTVDAYEKSSRLIQNQFQAGVASKADAAQARTQLSTAQAQLTDVGVQRAQLEHAIALLVGQPASTFTIARSPLAGVPPAVPVGLPSELLERRPDIAGAERRVAGANAQIGVAKAAYFPVLRLNADGGFQSSEWNRWFTVPSRFWSIGPSLAQILFDGGLRRALTAQAIAAYDASVAGYRETVLAAIQEVEDNLAALRILEREAQQQDEAVRSARDSLALTTNQYKAGTVNYLNVVTVQTTALNNERTAVDIMSRRLVATVLLVKALGGGWASADLPSTREVASKR